MTSQTIIITGASRGLGAAAARIAAGMGANVVLNARSADDLYIVAQDIQAAGSEALPIVGDIGQPEVARHLVKEAVDGFGRVDAIVNNAGVVEPLSPIASGDPDAWKTNWSVNVLGPMMLTQAALPYLRKRVGRVVNVSSGAADKVVQGWAAYCAAKAALNHFTNVLAEEEKEITAIVLLPGNIDTVMQTTIREEGTEGMLPEVHARFVRFYEEGELLKPKFPGRALAVLALHAPHEWSGGYVQWNDGPVQALVKRHTT
jgi:NAD(P)-dependent dehydrogenase (short-subunit alcohol dehydrogenase family)